MKQHKFTIFMFLAMISWGETWVSAKVLANYLGAYELVFWRFLFSLIGLIPVIFLMNISFKIKLKNLLVACVAGILLILYNKYFFLGTKFGDSGFGGVLVTTLIPIITFLILAIFSKKKIKSVNAIALVIGSFGTMTILNIWKYDLSTLLNPNIKYFLMAALIWPFITILSSYVKDVSPLVFSFYMFLFAALFDYLFILDFELSNVLLYDGIFWLNIALLSFWGTTFGTSVYFTGIAKLGSKTASSYFFLVPFSAMLFSAVFLGESVSSTTLIGGLMSMIAVYMINGFSFGTLFNKGKNRYMASRN